ncbi:MAG: HAD family phosphatase [Alistipes sp.]|nr:HAD family phosphatase [Alistipes sp.]
MKNIVFDLGGVVFMRDPKKCTEDFLNFFSFVRLEQMPHFWNEYDRGTLSIDEVKEELCRYHNCDRAKVDEYLRLAIDKQEVIAPTERLIEQLKKAGYRLYVLSNMSKEFIAFLRQVPVYRHFDGEVVSCEEGVCKPEKEIYQLLLERYDLNPQETLFIDDRKENIEAAEQVGITGFHFNRKDIAGTIGELRSQLKIKN